MTTSTLRALGAAALCAAAVSCSNGTSRTPWSVSQTNHPSFPIDPDAVHGLAKPAADGRIACESCHGTGDSFTQFSCVGCHEHRQSGADPDGSQGMDELHRGNSGYRYDSAACLSCHANGNATAELSRTEHGRYFPIEVGTSHAPLACGECHVGSSRAQVTCTGCHRDDNHDGQPDHDVAPMLAVHGSDMAALGYQWDSASCRTCHPASQKPGLLNHEAKFPIGPTTRHGGAVHATCADCHASRQNHTQLRCIECHQQKDDGNGTGPRDVHGQARMAEKHGGGALPGYQWESGSCYLCHAQAQVPGQMQHDRLLPLGAGTPHELGKTIDTRLEADGGTVPVTVACATCHQDSTNALNVTCTDCHRHSQPVMQPTHGLFPDYQWQSSSCVFCHLGGQKKLNHTFFPVGAGLTHALVDFAVPAGPGLKCSDCHASQTNRRLLACTSCHAHDAPTATAQHGVDMTRHGYSYDSAACFNCHPQSQKPGLFDHQPIYKLQPPSGNGKHVTLLCSDCHASRADRKGSLQCTGCHQPTSATDTREVHGQPRLAQVHAGFQGYAWSPVICIGCHTDGTKGSALTHLNHTWFPVGTGAKHALIANGGQLDCNLCHPTAGDFTPAAVNCTTCHVTKDYGAGPVEVHAQARLATLHTGVGGYAFVSATCLDCHPNSEPTGNAAHNNFPIAAGSKHAAVTCVQCHLGTGPKTDQTQLACFACHNTQVNSNPTLATLHTGVPNYAANSPACYQCHPNSEPVGPMSHPKFPIDSTSHHATAAYLAKVPAGKTSCSACHLSYTDRTSDNCQACHTSLTTPKPPTTAHSAMSSNLVNTSPGCKKCHGDAQVDRLASHTSMSYRHQGAKCFDCHPSMRTDKTFAADFGLSACTCRACHGGGTSCR